MKSVRTIIRIVFFAIARYFPFLLKIKKVRPSSLIVALTNRCNSKCVMCSYWKNTVTEELSFSELVRVFKEAGEAGVKAVTLYGGEPFLRKDIFDIISVVKENGMTVGVITNALLINEKMAEKIVKSGIINITISMDAVGDLNDELRGIKGAYEKSVKAISFLQTAAIKLRSTLDIQVGSIISLKTIGDNGIIKIADLCETMNISFIPSLIDKTMPYYAGSEGGNLFVGGEKLKILDGVVDKLVEVRKKSPKLLPFSISALKYIKRYFRDPASRNIPCLRGILGEVWLNTNGDLHTCAGLPPVGNIMHQGFNEIVFSKSWKNQTIKMFRKDCPGCSCTYNTNVESSFNFLVHKILEKIIYSDYKNKGK
ncbi:MAG: hypothetical protein A2231_07135 [Candidatus Firestonebacteria bacterium RIFOXYA2_FULL_40_8]|nr:MAG: hypothetical protein A2231_07135 [Candidatus Firestonebacteria bacterium RIFOXYA2_FULL_40_8]